MAKSLDFSVVYEFNTLKTGITVPVILTLGERDINFYAKVDTGSTHCIFERKHGERLNIEIETGNYENFGTATGAFPAYGHELIVSVLDIEIVSTVYFAKEESFTRNVLGRVGWLDRVKLGLIDYEGRLFLSEYGK